MTTIQKDPSLDPKKSTATPTVEKPSTHPSQKPSTPGGPLEQTYNADRHSVKPTDERDTMPKELPLDVPMRHTEQ